MEASVITAIAGIVPDVTEDQVRQVLTALAQVKEGPSVGTVLQDPETGSIAVRVAEDGLPLWRVTLINGGEYRETQPNLEGWVSLT